jgi:spermidine synthase
MSEQEKKVSRKKRTVYRVKTDFNNIAVTQRGNIVTLWSPATVRQTEIDIRNPVVPRLEYARNTVLSLAFCPGPETILVLGLGGGSIPMMFHEICKNASIDVVDIDPEMPVIAEGFFNFFTDTRLKVVLEDASRYVRETNTGKKYDIIVMDTFIGQKQHRTLTSEKFFSAVRDRLTPGGVFATNVMSESRAHYEKMKSRIGSAFKHLWSLPCETSTNTLVFAGRGNISKPEILSNVRMIPSPIPPEIPIKKLAKRVKRT